MSKTREGAVGPDRVRAWPIQRNSNTQTLPWDWDQHQRLSTDRATPAAGTGSTLATTLQRLSTGMRINSARDDAAGLAISERMTAQIRGNNMAARNANDGISYLQTADGGLASVSENLMRMRELAVQAGNSMMSDSDRQALQAEVDQLKQEVDRISSSAKFNGEFIFDQARNSAVGDLTQLAVLDGLRNGGWLTDAERLISEQTASPPTARR